ncbi:MAG TPA: DUF5698 domain-containing protein, partial [bacterium]|nr:DUF5698 domain-containing protein [bacterium]HOC88660.1 DUF5698 domain-containing protein [bacterium]HOZ20295.1 DUF5698 domain-containing protein [bacterium]
MDWATLLTGLIIFFARVTDVTLGTVRTIAIVHGRTKIAFMLGFVEVSVWLLVVAKVLAEVSAQPILTVFYAAGFSTGNVVGILLERRIAFGNTVLRVISAEEGDRIAELLRAAGYAVTVFPGEGLNGPVSMLVVVFPRKELQDVLTLVKKISPQAFYITEQAGSVSKFYRPTLQPPTGWRAVIKKK